MPMEHTVDNPDVQAREAHKHATAAFARYDSARVAFNEARDLYARSLDSLAHWTSVAESAGAPAALPDLPEAAEAIP